MRVSKLFGKTSKNEGDDYKIKSHRLLVKAGFIRESTAGRYYMMPLGVRVHEKIIDVVREHMDKSGAQELAMPVLHPLELWQETNRTNTTGFELMTVTDRREAQFALAGTAEEMAVDLVRKFNISYRDLPLNIYQFSTKFRDEIRARGGLLRVREFMMKDAYSFGTEEQFKDEYELMWETYAAIFNAMGLEVHVVASDNGYIGGEYCHEFVVPSEIGESKYFTTPDGSYAAHEDIAKFTRVHIDDKDEELRAREDVEGKGIIGVDELAKFLKIPVEKTTKTILFEDENERVIAAAVNGIYDINEAKLMHVTGSAYLALARPEIVKKVTGAEVGYAGILDLPDEVLIVIDESMKGRKNFEMGANKTDFHSINVNFGRDIAEPDEYHDIAVAKEGYLAPDSDQVLSEHRGIEVGNIFQLGYHYSNLMQGAEYTDESGERKKFYMGCYGIGIGRTMAAVVEALSDDRGIVWPEEIAPYLVYVTGLGGDPEIVKVCDELCEKLENNGVEVLYDDRDLRAGEKFADADLIGIPYRVVISTKTLAEGKVELKKRTEKEVELISPDELVARLSA